MSLQFWPAAAYTFGLAYELWAKEEVENPHREEPAAPSAKPQPAKTVKTTPTPAQSQRPAAKEEKPSAPAQVEPPLTADERELILNLLKDQHEKNRTAFDRFTVEYRAKFNVPERQKLSDHLKEKQHAEFTEQFFAALPPS